MKRFAFLVLVLSVAVIAENKKNLKYNRLLQICLHKAHMIEAEVQFAQKILMRIPDDNIIDNSMEILKKYGYFAACIEEDKGMIKDSKLVVGKIMAAIERNIGDYPVNKDFVKECVNALNEDSELTREERATDMERCMIAGYRQGQKEVKKSADSHARHCIFLRKSH